MFGDGVIPAPSEDAMTAGIRTTYTNLGRPGRKIVRQVMVGDGVIFDVDRNGRATGVETIGFTDWPGALAALAMAGEVILVGSIGQR